MLVTGARPTGEERLVRDDELFFSTTDRRGVILAGNSVFVRISGYQLGELIGAPHNIVRHPGMPGGAFKAMWDRLLAGKPMAAYVENLAKDGAAYWVFATITPLGDGFLSVRVAPMTPLYPMARGVYERLLAIEREARADGQTRAEAAARGALELDRMIGLLGYSDYDHFMMEALPAEVAARSGALIARFAGRSGPGPAREMLSAAMALGHSLEALVGRLDAYQNLSAELSESSESMLRAASQLESAAFAAREAAARAPDRAPVLRNVAEVMSAPRNMTVGTLMSVVAELGALRDLIGGLRFRIALARLHSDMLATFACEVIDGIAPPQSLLQVPLLCSVLHQEVEHMTEAMETVNAKLGSVAEEVGLAGQAFNDFRRFIGKWRLLVVRHHASTELAGHVAPIDQMLHDGHGQMAALHVLANRCQQEIVPLDRAELDLYLSRIQQAARRA